MLLYVQVEQGSSIVICMADVHDCSVNFYSGRSLESFTEAAETVSLPLPGITVLHSPSEV